LLPASNKHLKEVSEAPNPQVWAKDDLSLPAEVIEKM